MSDKSCPHDRGDIWLSGDGVYTSKRANPTCVFCPKDSMTPSEKKAREIFQYRFITDWQGDDPDGKRREMFIGNLIADMTVALSEAERRGFERAKRMACKKAEDFREDLENLKYEEA